ncbi:MAG: Na/Pi cotransporter family protein [Oscillospiraceae bacterium]|nr:Na/Pi cotransporter family protein [Oscillospiraceae bacterium]
MSIFNILTLFGGLAMFLYGMRLMGDSLQEGSGATLKRAMESVTDSPIKALLLGIAITAIIQSSTATIVITSGLVGAGIISLRQSLGIVIGANVGTTVTGQIIRLLDLNSSSTAWLQMFKPSTLAPVALIIGIVFIMFIKKSNSKTIGSIAMGFGILFSGLLNMTGSVNSLSANGAFDAIFSGLGSSPVVGYASGAGVAFVLQSSSATIGILQALSASGQLTFKAIYSVLVGIYLGDCVTTAIVCSIGAKPDARRVGIVNILFNLCETVTVFVVVTIIHKLGLLDSIWEKSINSGGIANTNTIFNLGCAIALFPMIGIYEKLSRKIVKDEKKKPGKYDEKLSGLSSSFFRTPALALNACYDILLAMLQASHQNIRDAFSLLEKYDEKKALEIIAEEENIDHIQDAVSHYLVELSPHIQNDNHAAILDEYYKVVVDFERLSDHAQNICEMAMNMQKEGSDFSRVAKDELLIVQDLLEEILKHAETAFANRDLDAARQIEPLEEVVDDMVNALRDNHIDRLREGKCTVFSGTNFLNLLSDIERISDICSNIGVATVERGMPELEYDAHSYISRLHSGQDNQFNEHYKAAHDSYFARLDAVEQ